MGNFLESNWTHRDEITIYDIKKRMLLRTADTKEQFLKAEWQDYHKKYRE